MIGDNPAARLLAILEAGKQHEQGQNCRAVWRQIFGLDKRSDALLISRIGKLMELPEQIIQIIQSDFPNQASSFNHWSGQVNQAFSAQNLNGEWKTFFGHIDSHTFTYLGLTADLIQTKSPTTILQKETIEELRKRIDQLMTETIESDFDPEIKEYVSRCLRKILVVLDEYRISGALPIIEAVEAAFGHAFFDEKYRETVSGTQLGQQFMSVLSAVANAVTIVLGAPQLPQTFQLMLEKFK